MTRRGCLTEMPVTFNLENSSMSTRKEITYQSQSASGSCLFLACGKGLLVTPVSGCHEREQRKPTSSTLYILSEGRFYCDLHFHSGCLSYVFSVVMVSVCQIVTCSLHRSVSLESFHFACWEKQHHDSV